MFFYWSLVEEYWKEMPLLSSNPFEPVNWKMYVKRLKLLCPLFFALNHHLYARWTAVHIRGVKVLEKIAFDLSEEFARDNFAVAKSRNR